MAQSAAELIFKIRGDTSSLQRDFSTAQATVKSNVAQIAGTTTAGFGQANTAAQTLSKAFTGVKTEAKTLADETKSLTGSFKEMTGSITAIAGPIVALVGGLIAVSREINKLSQEAIEAGSKFHDLSIQTGLNVETLSGLENQLKQSNTNLDQFNNGIFFLQKSLGAAAQGNKDLQATFAKLGIKDTNAALSDMEGTLRKVLTGLSGITDEGKRNVIGSEVMGRAYKDLRVFVEDLNGDVDGAIDKAKALGLVMSGEAAAGADRLGDRMDETRLRIERMRVELGGRFVASTEKALTTIDALLERNKGQWVGWKNSVIDSIGQAADFSSLIFFGPTKAQGDRAAAASAAEMAVENFSEATRKKKPGDDPLTPRGGGNAAEKARRDQESLLSDNLRGIENAYKGNTNNLQREYKLQLTNLDDFVQRSIEEETNRYNKTKAILEKQQSLAKPGTSEYAKYTRQLEDAERQKNDNIQKINDEADQARIDSLRTHQDELLKLQGDYINRSTTSLRAAAEARGITYEEAEQRILEIQNNAFDRRLEIVTREEQRYAQNTEAFVIWNDKHKEIIEQQIAFQEEAERRLDEARQKDIDGLLKVTDTLYNTELEYEQRARDSYRRQLDDYARWAARHILITRQTRAQLIFEQASLDQQEEAARHAKEITRLRLEEADQKRLLESTKASQEELLQLQKIYDGYREAETQRHVDEQNRINRQADEATKKGEGDSEGGIFGGIKEDLNNIPGGDFGLKPAAAAADAVTIAYRNMKAAVLDSVDAFIFSSATIGQVMRRAVAETLAEIGKEAALQAIKQGALALGALAAWDLRGFALHSAAAAAWLSITGGTMLAGRAVMGSQNSAGAALQQSTQPARGASSTSSPQPVVAGRTTGAPFTINRPETAAESRFEAVLRKSAEDHMKAASMMNAAANRIYGASASEVVRAGARGASHEIATAWGDAYEQRHPIRNQVRHDGPKGI